MLNASHLKIHRFHSALEAAELFRTLGYSWEIMQLSAGPLNGILKIRRSINTVCLSLQCNRSMLFHGGRNSAYVPFCLEMNAVFQHRVRGETLIPFGLYGFHLNLSDVFFQTEAGAHFGIFLIPRNRIQQLGALDPNGVLMESISMSNNIQLSPELDPAGGWSAQRSQARRHRDGSNGCLAVGEFRAHWPRRHLASSVIDLSLRDRERSGALGR